LLENLTLAALKDGARLLVYFAATILIGALLAPILFWAAQWLAGHGVLPALARFDFESFFHRALLIAAVVLLWPLLRSIQVRTMSDLQLAPDPKWQRHLLAGFVFSAIPLLCCGAMLIALHIFALRLALTWLTFAKIIGASIAVPAIEEVFFRGLVLGLLIKSGRTYLSILITSAFYSILHFLKAPTRTSTIVTWTSGFNSIAHSFSQFADPLLLAAGFTTLFLIGWVLADARLVTRSLWLPIGLHAGWIFANGTFNKIAHRQMLVLPWLGKNLLVGIVPLAIVCLTWAIMRGWLRYGARKI
jgi:membrane protease YdiL (CAAX protease family)